MPPGASKGPSDPAGAARLAFRRRHKKKAAIPARRSTPRATPTPIPAEVPAERPPLPEPVLLLPAEEELTTSMGLAGDMLVFVVEGRLVAELEVAVAAAVVADEVLDDVVLEVTDPADHVTALAWGLLSYWKTMVLPWAEGSKKKWQKVRSAALCWMAVSTKVYLAGGLCPRTAQKLELSVWQEASQHGQTMELGKRVSTEGHGI